MIVDDDRYEVDRDPYCYSGTDVLKNKAGLKDAALLRDFELEMTALRSREVLPEGDFDTAHYRAVHHHLFQDVYAWAGKYRTVRMSKGTSAFCFHEHIEREAEKLFRSLNAPVFQGGGKRTDFTEAASIFLGELNAIHCYRDGNGRAQLTFMHMLAARADHPMKLERVRRETFLPAMIASFHTNYDPLRKELVQLCRKRRRG